MDVIGNQTADVPIEGRPSEMTTLAYERKFSPPKFTTKPNAASYRINGYLDIASKKSIKLRTSKEAADKAAALIHIHRVLNNASQLPEISKAPPNFHMLAATTRAAKEDSRNTKGRPPSYAVVSTAVRNTYKQLLYQEKEKVTLSIPPKSRGTNTLCSSRTNNNQSSLYLASQHVSRGLDSSETPTSILERRPTNISEESLWKCKAWLHSCEPWWLVNDEYPRSLHCDSQL